MAQAEWVRPKEESEWALGNTQIKSKRDFRATCLDNLIALVHAVESRGS